MPKSQMEKAKAKAVFCSETVNKFTFRFNYITENSTSHSHIHGI